MPISAKALTALREATRWNPTGARALLAALQEHPDWVKYKADQFGPLHLILDAVPPRRRSGAGLELPFRPEPFPEALLPACSQFIGHSLRPNSRRSLRDSSRRSISSVIPQIVRLPNNSLELPPLRFAKHPEGRAPLATSGSGLGPARQSIE